MRSLTEDNFEGTGFERERSTLSERARCKLFTAGRELMGKGLVMGVAFWDPGLKIGKLFDDGEQGVYVENKATVLRRSLRGWGDRIETCLLRVE